MRVGSRLHRASFVFPNRCLLNTGRALPSPTRPSLPHPIVIHPQPTKAPLRLRRKLPPWCSSAELFSCRHQRPVVAADLVPPCLGRLLHHLFCPHGRPAKLLSASFSSSPSRHRHCCFLLQQDPEVDDATGFCSATLITATFSSSCCACRDLRPLLPCCSVVGSSNYQLP